MGEPKENIGPLTVDSLPAAARTELRRLSPAEAAVAVARGARLVDTRLHVQRRVTRLHFADAFSVEEPLAGMIADTGLDADTVTAWVESMRSPGSIQIRARRLGQHARGLHVDACLARDGVPVSSVTTAL